MNFYPLTKRYIDFLFAITAFLLLLPVFVIITICLLIINKENPFFFQKRAGKLEKVFSIIKFKTMKDFKNEEEIHSLKRVTKFGGFLRKFSLDEIPQLLNVIIGDMSIIGPRPLLTQYLPLYNNEQKKRHNIRPGITGWAQIKGRNTISWEQKFNYDVWYVNNQSFSLDFKIFLLTFKKLINTKDTNTSKNTSMPVFTGTPKKENNV